MVLILDIKILLFRPITSYYDNNNIVPSRLYQQKLFPYVHYDYYNGAHPCNTSTVYNILYISLYSPALGSKFWHQSMFRPCSYYFHNYFNFNQCAMLYSGPLWHYICPSWYAMMYVHYNYNISLSPYYSQWPCTRIKDDTIQSMFRPCSNCY